MTIVNYKSRKVTMIRFITEQTMLLPLSTRLCGLIAILAGLQLVIFGNGFPETFTKRRWGFHSRKQTALFMIWEEYWELGEVYYAKVLFTSKDWIGF